MKTSLFTIVRTVRLGRWLVPISLLFAAGVRAAEPTFTNVTATVTPDLPQVGYPTIAWSDFNNDGRLDFLLRGFHWTNINNSIYPVYPPPLWLNTGNGFTNVTNAVAPDPPRLSYGPVAWADFDSDGDLDYISTGGFYSQIWRDTGNGFTNVTDTVAPGLPPIDSGSAAWGDYDNDGRLDFLLTGGLPRRTDLDDDYPYLIPIAQLWRNTGSGFENVTETVAPGLAGAFWSTVTWADFDNDGRLDFLLTGATRYSWFSHFWRNTGSNFVNVTATVAPGFPGIAQGFVAWGDYDNDGRADLLVPGQVWRNTGSEFTNMTSTVAPTLTPIHHSAAAWGDYDDDGRLDFLIAGANSYFCDACDPPSFVSRVYRNNTAQTNAPTDVITKVPGNASQASIVLNGSIHPHRQAATAWFVWGDSANYGHVTAAKPLESGNSFTSFSQTISGLSTGVTYYYRAVGSNEQGQVVLGVEQSFLLAVPVVTNRPPGNPATMNAHVNPNNLPTSGWFEWGLTPAFGQVTPLQFLRNGFDATLSQNLSGVEVGATYHYRAVASNSVGVVYGAAQSLVAAEPIARCPLGFMWPDFRTHGYSATGGDVHFWIGCDWTAINTNEWITITSATNGPAGYGGFTYTVAHNIYPGRHGNITIGSHNVSITQGGGGPILIGHPTDQTVLAGETVTLSVAVHAAGPVYYQWYRLVGSRRVPVADGDGISGATTSNLVFTGVQASQAGMYLAQTSGGRSSWATLEVLCNFSFSATQATFSSLSATGSMTVSAAPCDWSIVNENPWVTILSAINNKGSGTVVYALAENPSAAPRTGEIIIADRTFTITQAGGGPNTTVFLPEALDTEGVLTWKTIGTPAWFGQRSMSHDGVDAAQSGPISNSAAATAQSIITGPGTLSFWWKVSSQTDKDFLKFFVNGVQQTRISGEVGWELRSYTLPSGTYTSKWTYSKSPSGTAGQDRGWLDQVAFVAGSGCVATLSHTNVTHYSGSESGEVSVTAAGGCTWDVFNPSPWITAVADVNSGLVRYTVAATTESRTGVLFIAGQPFTILQLPMSGPPVSYSHGAVEAWVRRHNGHAESGGGGNSDDQANAVAVDSRNGNVFVTGSSPRAQDPSHGTTIWNAGADYTTIAYSSAGVPLWTNFYNGPANNRDEAVAVALDSSGNVFVTGFSYQGAAGYYARDYATIKYSGAGVPLWTNRYVGSDYGAVAMVVDSSGEAIVTGNSMTLKYSGAGVLLWMNRFGGEAAAVAVDGSGNVFVTGQSVGSDGWSGYATVKYSRAGVPLWTNRYKGPGQFGEGARAVAVDGSGDVFVTGFSSGSSNSYAYATLKYSGAGVLLWARHYTRGYGHSSASALAVDGSGNVIVTGYSTTSDGYQDYATIKYSGEGVLLWTNHFGGPGISSDFACAVVVDGSGDVFVTGKSSDSRGGDYATIKYSAAGVPLWMKRYNGPANRDDSPRTRQSLALGPDGSVYVTGGSDGSPYDFATVKYVSVPLLTIRHSAAHIMVSWPSLFSDFTLQQNTSALATTNWSNVIATVEDDGTNRAVVVSPPTGNRFYRLSKP